MLIELFLLIVAVAAVVLAIRGGKNAKPEAPLVIDNERFHLTLALQLASVQTFIEDVAGRLLPQPPAESSVLYWEVRDPRIAGDCYLLAIALRRGKLYGQAIRPLLHEDHFQAIRQYSGAVLAELPYAGHAEVAGLEKLRAAVDGAAADSGVTVIRLDELPEMVKK